MISFPRLALIATLASAIASPVGAQAGDASGWRAGPTAEGTDSPSIQLAKALAGVAAGLGIHEAGHLIVGTLVGADFHLRKVAFAGVPFFAVSHAPDLSPREEYAVSSAGLWTQYLASEWILSAHPHLRSERRRFEEGVLAFHLGLSAIYAGAALAEVGPYERDTRAMAGALGVSERWLSPLVLAPAVLDGYRYLHPDARWAAWSSRALKAAMVGMVVMGGR